MMNHVIFGLLLNIISYYMSIVKYKANSFLADRNKPDYENFIKESITAVEAMSEIIIGIKGKEATLVNMLKKIEDRGIKTHGGLKSAFYKLSYSIKLRLININKF